MSAWQNIETHPRDGTQLELHPMGAPSFLRCDWCGHTVILTPTDTQEKT